MGRVARYKKIKAFDNNSRTNGEYVWGTGTFFNERKGKKRSLVARAHQKKKQETKRKRNATNDMNGFDLPPSGKDEFDLSNFRVINKQKLVENILEPDPISMTITKNNLTSFTDKTLSTEQQDKPAAKVTKPEVKVSGCVLSYSIPENDEGETQVARSLNLGRDGKSILEGKKVGNVAHGRREGESMNVFRRRMKSETQMALVEDRQQSSRKAAITVDRSDLSSNLDKSQRTKSFLTNKKKKQKGIAQPTDEYYCQLGNIDEAENNSFLDRVDEPPVLRLPKGALKKSRKTKTKKTTPPSEEQILSQQNEMEQIRQRVQATYALMKAKRRKQNNFHL